jgi:hypothetical protein
MTDAGARRPHTIGHLARFRSVIEQEHVPARRVIVQALEFAPVT